ncbi:hypothetical protein [Halorubrum ezzemoulense]|uniref:hypothetical protein n=1 Tax=Halorubrum ezzemoulense TaxID=337243 RepID=UPI00232CB18C|nr:hypothetical protein [Halorubrum ezzemoulense]MDB9252873.1 hypothetical protein [Halorubrum ezzemoulense]MDB9256743.1 hypothetical protein [Halorubrum ezzemoulense]MDB9277051.1 hypothetical protein [Halorubrum ezzemoulense]
MRQLVTQSFRGYCALAVIVAGFTGLWAVGVISVEIPVVGYAWFAVAGIGTLVAAGMAAQPEEVIEADATDERVEEFEETTVTGAPLNLYAAALAAWACVSFGWVLGGMSAAGLTVVGYGWLVVAAYGALVAAGLVATHSEEVTTAIDPSETLETDG